MEDYMQKWKREERRFTQFKLTGDADFDGLTLCAIEYETRKLRSEMIQHAL